MDDPSKRADQEKLDKAHWAAVALKMRQLTEYEEWDAYTQQLASIESLWLERMVAGAEPEYQYARGFLHGIRKAHSLPADILRKIRQK